MEMENENTRKKYSVVIEISSEIGDGGGKIALPASNGPGVKVIEELGKYCPNSSWNRNVTIDR